jgi:predicted nucleic acid-binding protein
MRLYLESSVLVKLFKRENQTDKMIEVVSRVGEWSGWFGYSSRWALLEVARALKKDGKDKELIELDLKELQSHRIAFEPLTHGVLSDAEKIVAAFDVYASDAVHAATYRRIARRSKLDGFLTDDRHFLRLKDLVSAKIVDEFQLR